MKKILITCLMICVAATTFAGPRDGRGHGRGHGGHRGHRHNRKHEDLYVANGILDLVGKGLWILRGPQRPVVVTQPVVTTPVVTQPVVQPVVTTPVVVTQPQVVQPTTQIIQVGQTKYLIYTDENGNRKATPIVQ